jgi:hypothetical protein
VKFIYEAALKMVGKKYNFDNDNFMFRGWGR